MMKLLQHAFLFFLLTIILPVSIAAQNDEKSTLLGNVGTSDVAFNICADQSGNKYIAGQIGLKGLIVKQSANNTIQWSTNISFTTNPNHKVIIGFLDIVGDTLFGCGKIDVTTTLIGVGCFYFKMNAQTGSIYWSKMETNDANYLSCMRYANGKFFLVGGEETNLNNSNNGGRVLAVSSQTGQIIWQNTGIVGAISIPLTNWSTSFTSATEMVNGKMFITGQTCNLSQIIQHSIIIGINENGIIFLQKFLTIPGAIFGEDDYIGHRIEYDQDQNIIMIVTDNALNSITEPLFIKLNLQGNLIYAKRYGFPNSTPKFLTALNETPTHYVLYGVAINTFSAGTDLYALKLQKDGTVNKTISIQKPNVSYYLPYGYSNLIGNSTFLNGLHYFTTSETAQSVFDWDVNQIILDEDLNPSGFSDCSEVNEHTFIETNVPVTVNQMIISIVPYNLNFVNGITIQDQTFSDPCSTVTLELQQLSICQTSITANVSGFNDPIFYWSNGTVGTNPTINVSSSDTIFVRVLDTKCCELIDTVLPVLTPSTFEMELPADTLICLQAGSSWTITPFFSGAIGTLGYEWSDNSTGTSLSVNQSGTYWLDLSDECQTVRDSITVTVNLFPIIGNTTDVDVCEGSFPVMISPTVSAGSSIEWDDNSTSINRTVYLPGNYIIYATNNCGTVSSSIAVTEMNFPSILLPESIDTCIQNGTSLTLIPIVSDVNTYLWSTGETVNQIQVFNSGEFTVFGSNECGIDSASSTVTIQFYPELDLPSTLDTCFEVGVGFSYTAQGSDGNYSWSSGSQTATEWINQEGLYIVSLSNVCGIITDSVLVRRITEVGLNFPEDSIKVCSELLSMQQLDIETNYQLEIFSPDGAIVNEYLEQTGWYLIHAFNPCGEKWDSIFVNLQNEQMFYLPNSFTPNADGINDHYEFKGENMQIREVRIFNRWGEEIFTEEKGFSGWDGLYKGESCPDGIYSVYLIYEDCFGIPTVFNGNVNLLR